MAAMGDMVKKDSINENSDSNGDNGNNDPYMSDDNPPTNNFMTDITNARLWVHQLRKNFSVSNRIDLTETVYFGTSLVLTKAGTYSDIFSLSDLITKFRIIANSFDVSGTIGYAQASFQTKKPIYIQFDIPSSFTVGDNIDITGTVVNTLGYKVDITFTNNLDPALTYKKPDSIRNLGA
jgi:hypothetical protein